MSEQINNFQGFKEKITKPKDLKISPKSLNIDDFESGYFDTTTHISFTNNGLKIIKRKFDSEKVPDDVDDANLDSAQFYDKDPQVTEIELSQEDALKALNKEKKYLEEELKTLKKDLEDAYEDEMTYRQIEELIYETEEDLEKIDEYIKAVENL